MSVDVEDLRYPVGKFVRPEKLSPAERDAAISVIEETPALLREAVRGLTEEQLETPYRPGGWTVRQVVHHLPDSHLNSYTRFRLAITEDEPTIRPYNEAAWAELEDARHAPVELSLKLLEAVHARWVILLRSFKPADFERKLRHPESGVMTIDGLLAMYDWHCKHHVAHITSLRQRNGW